MEGKTAAVAATTAATTAAAIATTAAKISHLAPASRPIWCVLYITNESREKFDMRALVYVISRACNSCIQPRNSYRKREIGKCMCNVDEIEARGKLHTVHHTHI